jgi:Flp pilus assembly protein TadD
MTALDLSGAILGADALLDAGKYELALGVASQVIAARADQPDGYALASRALVELGRFEEAVRAAGQAVSLEPHSAYYHRLAAVAMSKHASLADRSARACMLTYAGAEAQEAVRLAPREPSGFILQAEICARLDDIKGADTAIREALRLRPDSANVWAGASFVGTRAHNWYAAEIAARKALAIDPRSYAAANNLGVALRKRGRWMQGAVAFHGAARVDPKQPIAPANLESIGYQFIAIVVLVFIAPTIVIWPLFMGLSVATKSWLARKPERLGGVALRLGLWVATNRRHQRRFAKEVARAEKLAAGVPPEGWSALRKYKEYDGGMWLTAIIFVLAATAVLAVFAVVDDPSLIGLSLYPVAVFIVLSLAAGRALADLKRRDGTRPRNPPPPSM